MSASPVFSSAATSRHFIFPPAFPPRSTAEKAGKNAAAILAQVSALPKLASVVPATGLEVRQSPEMVSSGIPQLDSLTGGFPRGCLTEICGTASSGRTSVILLALARATQRGEVCALVDASNAFNPASAAHAGMELSRLLWVRCGEKSSAPKHPSARANFAQLEQVLKVTDLLLQSNGFGMIALDLGDIPPASARRIPLASWFRFRRAVEHTPTALLVLEQQPIAGSCSSVLLKVSAAKSQVSGERVSRERVSEKKVSGEKFPKPAHSELLDHFEITAELLRSRLERKLERKPVQSTATFRSQASWAG
jgi:hypothetical protein